MDDDFLNALSLLDRSDRQDARRRQPLPNAKASAVPPQDALELVPIDSDVGLPEHVVRILEAGPHRPLVPVRYEQRSTQLLQHARDEKRIENLKRRCDEASAERDAAASSLHMIVAESRTANSLSPQQQAIVKVRIASTGSRKGLTNAQQKTYRRAAAQVGGAIEKAQNALCNAMCLGKSHPMLETLESQSQSKPSVYRIHLYFHGFDETSQHCKRIAAYMSPMVGEDCTTYDTTLDR